MLPSGKLLEKLKQSGLTADDAQQLSITLHSAEEMAASNFPAAVAFKIPYFTLDGKANCFFRVRYLGTPPSPPANTFAAIAPSKPLRYMQAPNTPPRAYFPPLLKKQTWADLIHDPNQPIIITEGELKAACASKYVCPTIGLGGVWSFRSKRYGFSFLPELEVIDWAGRRVFIIFDSDACTNANVLLARDTLFSELLKRGASVRVVDLPALEEAPSDDLPTTATPPDPTTTTTPTKTKAPKTGLDDYIIAHLERHPLAHQSIWQMIEATQREDSTLSQFSRRFAYITTQHLVVDLHSSTLLPLENFRTTYGNVMVPSPSDPQKRIPLPLLWLKSTGRRTFDQIVMNPGQPPFIYKRQHGHTTLDYNTWKGWGVNPVAGDASPFYALLTHLFPSPHEQNIVLDWLAYPLQNPGAKLPTALLLVGAPGTGKSLLLKTIAQIYGATYKPLQFSAFEGGFTDWMESCFVLWDEFSIGNHSSQNLYDKLKDSITATHVTINKKFQAPYEIDAHFNMAFTSNYLDGLPLDADDRRFIVLYTHSRPHTPAFYSQYLAWLHGSHIPGASALFEDLLRRDLSKFDPVLHAPDTHAKQELLLSSHGELYNWCYHLINDPDQVLIRPSGQPLGWAYATSADLAQLYLAQHPQEKVTSVSLGRMLGKAGYRTKFPGWPQRMKTCVENAEQNLMCVGAVKSLYKLREGTDELTVAQTYATQQPLFAHHSGAVH